MSEVSSTWSDSQRPERGADPPEPGAPTPDSPAPPLDPSPGAVLGGRYRVVERLGEGGMGVVLRAEDVTLGREVALKLLRRGDPRQEERLRREAVVTASLRHPGIVTLHELASHQGQPFLVYELVPGGRTLEDLLAEAPRAQLLSWIVQAGRALGYAHTRGVVHRDVKPDNLLIDAEGRLRVADFGLATAPELERLTRTGQQLGTPRYMAPEQTRGQHAQVGPATDVWALGVVLYRALCKQQPFPAETLPDLLALIVHREPSPPDQVRPDVAPALSAVCVRALRKDPRKRQADGAQLADELEAALRGEAPPPRREARRAAGIAASIAAGALLAGGLTWLGIGALSQGEDGANGREPPRGAPAVSAAPTQAGAPAPASLPGDSPAPGGAVPAALVLPHGPGAVGVRFLADGRLLTWSGSPPWLDGAEPAPEAQPVIRLWSRSPGGWAQQREWLLAGLVDQLEPFPDQEAVLLVLRDPSRGWSLLRFELHGQLSHLDPLRNRSGPAARVTALALSPNQRWVALSEARLGGSQGRVELIPLERGGEAVSLHMCGPVVFRLAFLPRSGELLAASELADGRGRVTLWMTDLWSQQASERDPGTWNRIHHQEPLRWLEVDPSGQGWVGRRDGAIYRMEALPGDVPAGARLPGPVHGLRFLSVGRAVAFSAGPEPARNELQLIDTAEGRVLGAVRGWPHPLSSMDLSPDGEWVALGSCRGGRAELVPLAALNGVRLRAELDQGR